MSTTVLDKIRFKETTALPSKVDREAGIIRDVKVTGTISKNRRRYSPEALRGAIPLYEGAKVYIDHLRVKNAVERDTKDRWAKLKGVYEKDGELYARELHYIKSHPLTEQIIEAIEKFNDFGLSHDASGSGRQVGSEYIVESIEKVHSVDVVQSPATNDSFFESIEMSQETKRRKVLEVLRESTGCEYGVKLIARLTEMADEMPPMLEMDEPPMEMGDEDKVGSAIRTAINAILDQEGDLASKLKKIKMLLKTEESVKDEGMDSDVMADETDSEETEESNSEDDDMKESQKRIAELEAENKVLREEKDRSAAVSLLESYGVEPTSPRVKAVMAMDEKDRPELAKSFPRKGSKPDKSKGRLAEGIEPEVEAFDADDIKDIQRKLMLS